MKNKTQKMEAKFKVGDLVGFKSDSEFTKSNRELKPKKITKVIKTKYGFEYKISNYIGFEREYDLELRSNF